MRSSKTNFNIEKSSDNNKVSASTLKKIKSAKWFVLAFAVVVLASDVLTFALSNVAMETTRYWLFPLLLLVVDLVYVALVLFTNFRFGYSVRLTAAYIVVGIALLAASVAVAMTVSVVMSIRAVLVLCGTHVLYWVVLVALGYFLLKKDGKIKWTKGISLILLGTIAAAMCAVFVLGHGYFGQSKFLQKGRDIVYRFDQSLDGYVATKLILGKDDTVYVPETFNGKKVVAIDCELFGVSAAKTVYVEGTKERKLVNTGKLQYINPDLKLMVEKSVVDAYRRTLYQEGLRAVQGRDELLHALAVSNVPNNQTTITFDVANNDLAGAFAHIFIPTIYKNIGEQFSIQDLSPYLQNYIGNNDAENEFDLAYNFHTNGGNMLSFAHEWNRNDKTQGFLAGEVLEDQYYSAMLTFERVVNLEFSAGNDTVYQVPDEFKSISEGDTRYDGRYAFRSQLSEFFAQFPARQEFGVGWNVGASPIANGAVLQDYVTTFDLDTVRMVPKWELQMPAAPELETDALTASYTYGDDIRLTANAATSVVKTHYALSYGTEKLVEDSLNGMFDLVKRKPAQSGRYTVTLWKQDTEVTSLVSQKVSSDIYITIAKKEIGLIWTLPNGVYDATEKTVSAQIVQDDLLTGDSAGIAVMCKQNNVDVGLSVKNAGTYRTEASITLASELYQLKAGEKTQQFTIQQSELTADWSHTALTYNGTVQTPVALATGVGADGAIDVAVAGGQKNAGSYMASASIQNKNYKLVNAQQEFMVAKKVLTAEWDTTTSFVYNATKQGVAVQSLNGVIAGEEDVMLASLIIGGKETNVGTYDTVLTLPEGSNYQFETAQQASYSITQKALSVAAEDKNTIYSASAFTAFSCKPSGLEGADALAEVLIVGYQGSAVGAVDYAAGGYVIMLYVNAEGKKFGNYDITFVNGTLTIEKAALDIVAANRQKTYDGQVFTAFKEMHTLLAGSDQLAEVLTVGYQGSAVGAVNYAAGGYVITPYANVEGTKFVNYDITFVKGMLTIDKAALSIAAVDKQKTYDGQTFAAFAETHTPLADTDTLVEVLTVGYQGSAVGAVDYAAGGYVIAPFVKQQGTKFANYDITFVNGTLTIDKAALSIAAVDKQKTYDGQTFAAFTKTHTSLAGTDTLAEVLTVGYQGSAVGAVNYVSGGYVITPYVESKGTKFANYAITFENGTLTIDKAELTVTAVGGTKEYDGVPFVGSSFTVLINGLAAGDTVEQLGTIEFYGDGTTSRDVSVTPYTLSARFATLGAKHKNYQILFEDGTVVVTPAALSIAANGGEKTYDGKIFGYTYRVEGLKGQDSIGQVGTVVFGGTGASAVDASDTAYPLTVLIETEGPKFGNYQISFVAAEVVIKKAALTVTAVGGEKTYDGKPFVASIEVVGVVGQDTVSDIGTFAVSGDGVVNAGEYVVTASLTERGAKHKNYAIEYHNGSIKINQKALTVTVSGGTKVYDGSVFGALSYTHSTLAETDTLSDVATLGYTGAGVTQVDVTAGAVVTMEVTAEGTKFANYALTIVAGSVVITEAPLTLTAVGGSKTYDGKPYAATYQVAGLVGGDTEAEVGTFAIRGAEVVDAGTHSISVELKSAGAKRKNYNFINVDGTVVVKKAALTVTVTGGTKEYDGKPFDRLSYMHSALAETDRLSEVVTLRYTGAGVTQVNATAGTAVTMQVVVEGNKFGNYTLNIVQSVVIITPKTLTVTAVGGEKVYDGKPYPVAYQVAGLIVGDTEAEVGVFAIPSGTVVDVGTHSIEVVLLNTGAKHGNYQITFVDGTVTITPAALTIAAEGGTKEYDGMPFANFGISAEGLADGDTLEQLGTIAFTGTGVTAVDASATPYPLFVQFALTEDKHGNYQITFVDGTVTITPAALTIAAVGGTKEYDGMPFANFGISAVGLVDGDSIEEVGMVVFGGSGTTAVDAADTAYPLTVSITANGAKAGNYTIKETVSGEVWITKKAMTVSWSQTTFVENGTAQAPIVALTGVTGIVIESYRYFNAAGDELLAAPSAAGSYIVQVVYTAGNYTVSNTKIAFEITAGGEAI